MYENNVLKYYITHYTIIGNIFKFKPVNVKLSTYLIFKLMSKILLR